MANLISKSAPEHLDIYLEAKLAQMKTIISI
jgi:hypothetical protein